MSLQWWFYVAARLGSRAAVVVFAAVLAAPVAAETALPPARTVRIDGTPERFLVCDQPGRAVVVGVSVGRRVVAVARALEGDMATLDQRRCEPPPGVRPSVQCSLGRSPAVTHVDVRLSERARRAGRGTFGQRWEYRSLRLRRLSGLEAVTWADHEIALQVGEFFEDRSIRHVAVPGGAPSESCGLGFLVIQSHQQHGAALVLYALAPLTGLAPLVTSDPLGSPALWRDVIGVADVVGDGRLRVIEVVDPHQAGRLQLDEIRAGRFEPGGALEGYTSHRFGTPRQGIGAVFDATGDGIADIVLPSRDWKCLAVVTAAGGELRDVGRLSCADSPIVDVLAADIDGNGRPDVLLARDDGTISAWMR